MRAPEGSPSQQAGLCRVGVMSLTLTKQHCPRVEALGDERCLLHRPFKRGRRVHIGPIRVTRPRDELQAQRPQRCKGRLGVSGGGAEPRTRGLALLERGHDPLPQLAGGELAQVSAIAACRHRELQAHQPTLERHERVRAGELVRAIQVGAVRLEHRREAALHPEPSTEWGCTTQERAVLAMFGNERGVNAEQGKPCYSHQSET